MYEDLGLKCDFIMVWLYSLSPQRSCLLSLQWYLYKTELLDNWNELLPTLFSTLGFSKRKMCMLVWVKLYVCWCWFQRFRENKQNNHFVGFSSIQFKVQWSFYVLYIGVTNSINFSIQVHWKVLFNRLNVELSICFRRKWCFAHLHHQKWSKRFLIVT